MTIQYYAVKPLPKLMLKLWLQTVVLENTHVLLFKYNKSATAYVKYLKDSS